MTIIIIELAAWENTIVIWEIQSLYNTILHTEHDSTQIAYYSTIKLNSKFSLSSMEFIFIQFYAYDSTKVEIGQEYELYLI